MFRVRVSGGSEEQITIVVIVVAYSSSMCNATV